MTATPREVYENHVSALATGDPRRVVTGYTVDAVLASNDGCGSGHPYIHQTFERFLGHGPSLTPVTTVHVEGDVVFVTWRADTDDGPLAGADTFVVRDGLIAVHTGFIARGRPRVGGTST